MTPARYLVQDENKILHSYWNLDTLLIDIGIHKGESIKVFKMEGRICPKYYPVTVEDLRAEYERQKRESA